MNPVVRQCDWSFAGIAFSGRMLVVLVFGRISTYLDSSAEIVTTRTLFLVTVLQVPNNSSGPYRSSNSYPSKIKAPTVICFLLAFSFSCSILTAFQFYSVLPSLTMFVLLCRVSCITLLVLLYRYDSVLCQTVSCIVYRYTRFLNSRVCVRVASLFIESKWLDWQTSNKQLALPGLVCMFFCRTLVFRDSESIFEVYQEKIEEITA